MNKQKLIVLILIFCSTSCSYHILRLPDNTLEPEKIIMFDFFLHHILQESIATNGLPTPSVIVLDDTLTIFYPDRRVEMFTKDSVYITGRYAVVDGDTLKMASFYYYKDGIMFMSEGFHYGSLTRRLTHIKGKKYALRIYQVGIVPSF